MLRRSGQLAARRGIYVASANTHMLQTRKASLSAVRTSDTKEIEHPQRMAGLEKLQRGARRRDEGPLWAEGASKLGGGICLRVAYRAARRGVVRSPFFAVVGLMGLSRRIAAPEAGHLGPDQAGIACIRVGMPIREASCHRLISDIHADRSD